MRREVQGCHGRAKVMIFFKVSLNNKKLSEMRYRLVMPPALQLFLLFEQQGIPGGSLRYKSDGGGPTEPNNLCPKKYMDLILCTQENTRLEILDPKNYMTFIP